MRISLLQISLLRISLLRFFKKVHKFAIKMRIYALCFELFYFISVIFWLFLPNLGNANLDNANSTTKSRIRQEPSVILWLISNGIPDSYKILFKESQ